MTITKTNQMTVNYTISGQAGYAVLTQDELATLRTFAANNSEMTITGVKTYKRRSVR